MAVVELVAPFERGELHGFEIASWSSPMDDLGLVKTVNRFGESIVVTIANAFPTDGSMPASASRSE